MPFRRRQLLQCAAPWLLLLVLPGCLTQSLWSRWSFRTVTHKETASETEVELGWHPESGVAWAVAQGAIGGGDGGHDGCGKGLPRGSWTFSPREDADVAAALLSGFGDFRIRRAAFQVYPRGEPGQDLSCAASLRLEGAFLAAGIGTVADDSPLSANGPRTGVPADALPAPLDEILRYAAAVDLAQLLGQAEPHEPWPFEACTFVDGDLAPVDAARAIGLLGADFAAPTTGLSERLRRLAGLRLLAVVESGGLRTRMTLRADVLWLRQRLQAGADGLLVHDSRWAATERRSVVSAGAATLTGTVCVHSVVRRYESDAGGTLRRVVLTPLAVAVDVVMCSALALVAIGPYPVPRAATPP